MRCAWLSICGGGSVPKPLRHGWAFAWSLCLAFAFLVTFVGLPSFVCAQSLPANELRGHGGAVRAMALLAQRDILATGGFDSAIILWDLNTAAARRVLRHHDSTVNALAAIAPDCLASGGEDGRIALWCGDGVTPRHVITGHSAPISALLPVPNKGLLLSSAWDHTIRLWRSSDGAALGQIDGHSGPVTGLALMADGAHVASVGYDGQIRVTPLMAGAQASAVLRLETPINAVVAARDGTLITAGADGKIRVFDSKLTTLSELDLAGGPLNALALSPDGQIIATAGIRTQVTLIERATMKVSGEILGPGLPVWTLVFSADGNELFSGGADRALRRWDPKKAAPSGGDLASAEPLQKLVESEEGARVFRACRACHSLLAHDNQRAGPTLHGIMGRKIASAAGYSYSPALQQRDLVWTPEAIAKMFEIGPNAFLPGTKMPEQTISDPQARRALVEWLAKVTRGN